MLKKIGKKLLKSIEQCESVKACDCVDGGMKEQMNKSLKARKRKHFSNCIEDETITAKCSGS